MHNRESTIQRNAGMLFYLIRYEFTVFVLHGKWTIAIILIPSQKPLNPVTISI